MRLNFSKNETILKLKKSMGAKTALIAMLAFFQGLIACNKNSSDSGPAVNPPPYYGYNGNCPTCGPGMMGGNIPLLQDVKSATGMEKVLFALDFMGDSRAAGGYMNPQELAMDPKAVLRYAGPVFIGGVMRVVDPSDVQFCNPPPGDYDVRSIEPMQMTSGLGSGGRLEANGRQGQGRISMKIYAARLYNPETVSKGSMNNRVGFEFVVDFVNGRPCGSVSTF